MQALLGATSDASVRDVVWSPDGELLLAASIDGSSRVWRLDFGMFSKAKNFGRRRLTGNASRTIVEAEDNETLYFSVSEPNSTNETWRRSDRNIKKRAATIGLRCSIVEANWLHLARRLQPPLVQGLLLELFG